MRAVVHEYSTTSPRGRLVDIIVYRAGFAADKKVYVPHIKGVAQEALTSAKDLKEYLANHEGEEIDVEHKRDVQPLDHCLQMVLTSIHAIQDVVGNGGEFFITGKGNFRSDLATIRKYKGNRSEFDRPTHYEEIRRYLKETWNALEVSGQEADDEIGIRAYEINEQSSDQEAVIVSIDKDLDMIAGYHYNWVNKTKYKISAAEGIFNFYIQMLVGDNTDNIPGIRGIGPKKALALLDGLSKEKALYSAVRDCWHEHHPHGVQCEDEATISVEKALLEVGRLLWIRRERNEPLWEPPL